MRWENLVVLGLIACEVVFVIGLLMERGSADV